MKVFIGYDRREDIAYQVCKYSIESRQPRAEVIPLIQEDLKKEGYYWRDRDALSSTEFTFTRFLVPVLTNYEGWAVFCDCDFLWQIDIKELFKKADDRYAVMVVKHDYQPSANTKMDGCVQHPYPRKNWSSMVLWNCAHPSNKQITAELVNKETGKFLHRFSWLKDEEIGELHCEWNWLVGWHNQGVDGIPKAIHYTEGGPWFDNCIGVELGANWEREKHLYEKSKASPRIPHKYENLPPDINSVIEKILHYRVDPANDYYTETIDEITKDIEMLNNNAVVGVDSEFRYERKGYKYDPFLENFILGSGGQIGVWAKAEQSTTPCVIRGLGRQKAIKDCMDKNRDFYYIDTGYFGNDKRKNYHRITKNALQNLGPVVHRPRDRLAKIGWEAKKFRPGRNILLVTPSNKVMTFFNIDVQQWIEETKETIKKFTDRPIIVREKQPRSVRIHDDTIEMALDNDVHCLVTFNSIAATESLLYGKPAFTLGPNSAQLLCHSDLSKIENPYIPTLEEVEEWAAHLSYCQYTPEEIANGFAWKILNEENETSDIFVGRT